MDHFTVLHDFFTVYKRIYVVLEIMITTLCPHIIGECSSSPRRIEYDNLLSTVYCDSLGHMDVTIFTMSIAHNEKLMPSSEEHFFEFFRIGV